MADVVVLGRMGRDLVLRTSALPEPRGSATVGERRELLGGRGANQAVALAQLGVPVALVGVVGDDSAGTQAVAQAAADGIDVSAVVRRRGAATALVVDLVEDGGVLRLLEDVPGAVLLIPDDVAAATDQLPAAQVVSLQLQQPGTAVGAAPQRVPEGAIVVVDGEPEDDATRDAVPARADVVRADATEARLLTGRDLSGWTTPGTRRPSCSPPGRGWSRWAWGRRATWSRDGPGRGSASPRRSWRSTPAGPTATSWSHRSASSRSTRQEPGTPTSPRSSRRFWAALPRRTPPGPRRRPPG